LPYRTVSEIPVQKNSVERVEPVPTKNTFQTGEVVESADNMIGQDFGMLGRVVENPGLTITTNTKHGLDQVITREIIPSNILNTVKSPSIVLQQASGNYLYLSENTVVILNKSGKLITAYQSSLFDDSIWAIFNAIR